MKTFRTGLSYMFKFYAISFTVIFILSFFIENDFSKNHLNWYLVLATIISYALSLFVKPTIEVDNDGNAIPKRK